MQLEIPALANTVVKQEGFQLAEASFLAFRKPLRQVLPRHCLCWAASIASRSCLAWELRRGCSINFIKACQGSTKLCLKLEITLSSDHHSPYIQHEIAFPVAPVALYSILVCSLLPHTSPSLHNVNPLTIRTFCKARKILSILWDGRRKRRSMQSGRLNADKTWSHKLSHIWTCLWMSWLECPVLLRRGFLMFSWSHIPSTDSSITDMSQLSWPMFCSGT